MEEHHCFYRCKSRQLSLLAKKKKHNSQTYGIDRLPEEMLIAILSCLGTKEAVRTSILSRKWRYLWRFTSAIEIVQSYDRIVQAASNMHLKHLKQEFERLAIEGKSMVNHVVKLHQGPSVDKFFVHVRMPYHRERPSRSILDLVRFAMQKDVKVFELGTSGQCFPDLNTFLSMSRAVALEKPTNHHITGGFSSLTSFCLSGVNIQDEMIQYLLSNCPLLERLFIACARTLRNLNVTGPKSLRYLYISKCLGLRSLTVSAANLISFEYGAEFGTEPVDLKFQDVPFLSEVTLKGQPCGSFLFTSHRHSYYSHQLKTLILDVPYADVTRSSVHYHCLSPLPQLQRLKHLELALHTAPYRSLKFFVLLTTACPLLSSLVVQFHYPHESKQYGCAYGVQEEIARVDLTGYHHEHLRVVEFINFACYGTNLEFALALLGIAKSLEKMIFKRHTLPGRLVFPIVCYEMTQEHAKQLEAKLPHGAELVIQN